MPLAPTVAPRNSGSPSMHILLWLLILAISLYLLISILRPDKF